MGKPSRRRPLDAWTGNNAANHPVGLDTDEFFGELVVPLLGNDFRIPGVELLEINGAIREIDNSLSGNDTVWTAGGRWKPIRDLTIRGNYTESIRSPSLVELFAPQNPVFGTAQDPCDEENVNDGPNPDLRRANCIAAGIDDPDNFVSNIEDFTASGS
ncbi:MAG: TonB-dependent receptor domain-containing protein, partial [Wenzhouxiangellaceae bacterium]